MRHLPSTRSAPLRLLIALALLAALILRPPLPIGGTGATASATGATISTAAGQPGSAVTFGAPPGTFDGGSPVAVRFQDANPTHIRQLILTRNADPNGSFTATLLVPQPAAGGAATFSLAGTLRTLLYTDSTTSQPVYAEVPVTPQFPFLVLPSLALSGTTHAPPGGTVQVIGDGYTVNSIPTAFRIGGIVAAASGAPIGTDSYGHFVATLFVPVTLAPGSFAISATDSAGASASAPGFVIDALGGQTATATSTVAANRLPPPTPIGSGSPATSRLLLQPSSGPPGFSGLALIGTSGALPNVSVATVFFTDAAGNPVQQLGTVGVDPATGQFSGRVNIPAQAAGGTARIQVVGGASVASAQFTVTPLIALSALQVLAGGTVTITGSGFAPHRTIGFTANGSALPTGIPVISDGFGSFSATVAIPSTGPLGGISILAGDGTALAPAATLQVQAPPTATPTPSPTFTASPLPTVTAPATSTSLPSSPTRAYFAEGYTGQAATNGTASFTEVLNIFNPANTVARAEITYSIQGAAQPLTLVRDVAPGSVLRELVNGDVGPDRIVAAVISSPRRLYTTRTITRISPTSLRLDGSTTQPAPAPATTWAFAEGYTGVTFQQYLTVLNPGSTSATVRVTLAPQAATAEHARTLTLVVPARGRSTANIRALNRGGASNSVGMLIRSDRPIVPERVIYFGDGAGSGKFGSTVSGGSTVAARTSQFGYGSSGGLAPNGAAQGDQQYITLLNPALAGAPVQVTASFVDGLGHGVGNPRLVTVAAGTRQTILVNRVLGPTPRGPFSSTLSATAPIEAEAAQYYGGSPNVGRHPGVAFLPARRSGTGLFLSDLSTLLADGSPVQRIIYLHNAGQLPLDVRATYYASTGAQTATSYIVPAGGVTRVDVNAAVSGALPPGPLGATLTPLGGSLSAVAIGRTLDGQSALEDVGVPV